MTAIDRQEIATRIKTFLETELPAPDSKLTDGTDLLDEWFVDSFALIETVMFLETSFGIKIERADINGENFQNVAALTDFVVARLAG